MDRRDFLIRTAVGTTVIALSASEQADASQFVSAQGGLGSVGVVETIQDLRRLPVGLHNAMLVKPAEIPDQDNGGLFVWRAQSTDADNGGTVISPAGSASEGGRWIKAGWTMPSVKDFGGIGDGVADDTKAFYAAVANGVKKLVVPEGTYNIKSLPKGLDLWVFGRVLRNGRPVGSRISAGVSDVGEGDKSGGFVIGGDGPGPHGIIMRGGGNSAWCKIQPTRRGSQLQYQLYTAAYAGIAETVEGTGFIELRSGRADYRDVVAGDVIGFGGQEYRIRSIQQTGKGRIELALPNGSPVRFNTKFTDAWRHAYQYNEGICDVDGTKVVWKDGDYFDNVNKATRDLASITINGKRYGIARRVNKTLLELTSSAGSQNNVPFVKKDISLDKKVVVLNLQTLRGRNEENFVLFADITGRWRLAANIAKKGRHRPITIRTGDDADRGKNRDHLTVTESGQVLIGALTPRTSTPKRKQQDMKLELSRRANAIIQPNGTEKIGLFRMQAEFKGKGSRAAEFYFLNDLGGLNLQSLHDDSNPAPLSINPRGGQVEFGDDVLVGQIAKADRTGSGIALKPVGSLEIHPGGRPDDAAIEILHNNVPAYVVRSDGSVYSAGGVQGTISDARVKERVVDATPKLQELRKARVVNYSHKGKSEKHIGFVAQELRKIWPGLVDEGSDGYLSVKTSVLVPILVKAVQEMAEGVDLLKARVEELENEN